MRFTIVGEEEEEQTKNLKEGNYISKNTQQQQKILKDSSNIDEICKYFLN